jgi:IclR family acetate operon transcriptional repressor
MTMTDERALELATGHGLGQPKQYGPQRTDYPEGAAWVCRWRPRLCYATVYEVFAPELTAMAAPVQLRGYLATGCTGIARPAVRLTEKRMATLGPALVAAANELAAASLASPLSSRVR